MSEQQRHSTVAFSFFVQSMIGAVLAVTFGLLISACGQSASEDDGDLRIVVIPKGTTHVFWKSVHAGAIKAEREINGKEEESRKVRVIWKGPQKEDDREQQIQVVENFVSSGVHGIVLAPLDDTALLRPVQAAASADIPVVIMDSGLKGDVGKDYLSYVATDNYQGGVLGAQRLAELLGGEGEIILLRYQEGSDSTTQRENGFLDTMKKEFPRIVILSDNLYAGATSESAQQKSENLLTRFRDQVDGIFCPNESSTAGMLSALQAFGLAGKVKFVGFDSSEDLIAALKGGELHGLVLQNPINMSYLGVKVLHAHFTGETYEERIDTGVTVVTPENVDQPEMRLLHSPDLSEWLDE